MEILLVACRVLLLLYDVSKVTGKLCAPQMSDEHGL